MRPRNARAYQIRSARPGNVRLHFHDASEVWGQAPRAVVVSLVQAPAVRRVLSDGLQYAKLAAVAGREVEQLDQWEISVTGEVRDWITALDDRSHRLVVQAIDLLARPGPGAGPPDGGPYPALRDPESQGTAARFGRS